MSDQKPCPYCGSTTHEPIHAPIGTLYACDAAPADEFAISTGAEAARVRFERSTEDDPS